MWNLGSLSGKGEDCDEEKKDDRCVLFAGGEMERTRC